MPVTFDCHQVGQNALWNKSAFEDRAVKVENAYVMLSGEVFKSLQTFHTKKETVEFCQKWNLPQTQIVKVQSRFQFGWAIGLGRSYFVPDHAEGLLVAHALGCEVRSIEDERMWQAA